MSRLWKNAPDEIVKKTGIFSGAVEKLGKLMEGCKKALTGEKAWISKTSKTADIAHMDKKLKAIVDYLANNGGKAKDGIALIDDHIKTINSWKSLLTSTKYNNLLDDAAKEMIRVKTINLEVALKSVRNVLEHSSSGKVDTNLLTKLLKGITDPQAGRWDVKKVAEFLGDDVAKEVKHLLYTGETEKAIQLISKRPIKLIDDGVKEVLYHKRWLKRVGFVALGVLAATAIYAFFFMGNNNKYNPEIKANKG